MSLPKLLAIVSVVLFTSIGIAAYVKKDKPIIEVKTIPEIPLEVELDQQIQSIAPAIPSSTPPIALDELPDQRTVRPLPEGDRVQELFNKQDPRFPIVETIHYRSHVSWLKGRPAWLSDYASYFATSRHFIARSLNGKADYYKQEVGEGDKFNVFRRDKTISFHLVVDTSRCKMWFYYVDENEKKNVLIKTYHVGLGRIDSSKNSGLLTPLGKYTLGDRIAIYKNKVMGPYQGKKVELITVFGTRWIPFEKEIGECTAPAKGYGIHGTPWTHESNGQLTDKEIGIGKYESDGCIRMSTKDVEELFSIVITKPTVIEIVRDFWDSSIVDN